MRQEILGFAKLNFLGSLEDLGENLDWNIEGSDM